MRAPSTRAAPHTAPSRCDGRNSDRSATSSDIGRCDPTVQRANISGSIHSTSAAVRSSQPTRLPSWCTCDQLVSCSSSISDNARPSASSSGRRSAAGWSAEMPSQSVTARCGGICRHVQDLGQPAEVGELGHPRMPGMGPQSHHPPTGVRHESDRGVRFRQTVIGQIRPGHAGAVAQGEGAEGDAGLVCLRRVGVTAQDDGDPVPGRRCPPAEQLLRKVESGDPFDREPPIDSSDRADGQHPTSIDQRRVTLGEQRCLTAGRLFGTGVVRHGWASRGR